MTSHQPTQTFASIGIDIGKDVFHIVGFDTSGKGEEGPRWRPEARSASGYVVRHPSGF